MLIAALFVVDVVVDISIWRDEKYPMKTKAVKTIILRFSLKLIEISLDLEGTCLDSGDTKIDDDH